MKMKKCLLDTANPVLYQGVTIGERIAAMGKVHLWESRDSDLIDTVVIHFISAVELNACRRYDLASILGIFCQYGVSSHYLISRRGKTYQLVPEEHKAWHCGGSIMPHPDNRTGVNRFSIGVELMGTCISGFTSLQYKRLCLLCSELEARYGRVLNFVGHDQIGGSRAVEAGLRMEPKTDPGDLFRWDFFFDQMDSMRKQKN